MKKTLKEAVADRDLWDVERIALSMTYRQLIAKAEAEGVDLSELESLLIEIS